MSRITPDSGATASVCPPAEEPTPLPPPRDLVEANGGLRANFDRIHELKRRADAAVQLVNEVPPRPAPPPEPAPKGGKERAGVGAQQLAQSCIALPPSLAKGQDLSRPDGASRRVSFRSDARAVGFTNAACAGVPASAPSQWPRGGRRDDS